MIKKEPLSLTSDFIELAQVKRQVEKGIIDVDILRSKLHKEKKLSIGIKAKALVDTGLNDTMN